MKNFNLKPIFKKVVKEGNPLNGPNEHEGMPENPQDVVEIAKAKKVKVEKVEDRSAYNCPACKGSGLLDDKNLCPRCQGTGKN